MQEHKNQILCQKLYIFKSGMGVVSLVNRWVEIFQQSYDKRGVAAKASC
ncbi:hypothetical protein J2Y45_004821 [Dyadobacter sp. BE34]|uniref:Transposase n=1 Tax=Dyadobacter fermentans TaxID=94254 RepID=A0ABU1R2G5_9BACT|nr:hypothetical protein [Dyadobacter fermentans]MDR7045362.1 hypothetical protein [Dyadobacter sp. BE242]MDR7199675.1 hypothetical protein [Dyadobacter sp. BE34]MDR7217866.1 hypothetical protein [Dyadobacter sp. BE31]MDR7265566.1 hypothetical protein [Dyadobacter sp. BE32]